MPTFLHHETITCAVTFVRRVEADNRDDAEKEIFEGGGTLLGVTLGDIVAGRETSEWVDDVPHNLPVYPEPVENESRSEGTWFTVWVAERSEQGTHFVQGFRADTIGDAKRQALEECAACWGYDQEDIMVLGVVAGDVTVLEWNDEEDCP